MRVVVLINLIKVFYCRFFFLVDDDFDEISEEDVLDEEFVFSFLFFALSVTVPVFLSYVTAFFLLAAPFAYVTSPVVSDLVPGASTLL